MSDGLLDQLGLSALAGFAVGLAVAGNPDDRRTPQQLGRETLAECLRLVADARVATAFPAAAALPPVAQEEPRPRRGRRPRPESAPVEAIVAADAGLAPPPEAPPPAPRRGRRPRPEAEAPVEPPQEEPTPRRRPQPEPGGNGTRAVAVAPPPLEAAPTAEAEAPARAADGRINLNTASRAELLRLPRIGAQAADRILAFREQQGRITGVRQLRTADVLSAAQWRQIRDLVRF